MILIHDIKEDFNITYLHVKSRPAPKSRTGMTEKEALKQMRKPMIHLGSYETNKKQEERKLSGN